MNTPFQERKAIKGLLADLENEFPNTIPPHKRLSESDFRELQGQQQVIQYVRNHVDDEEEPPE